MSEPKIAERLGGWLRLVWRPAKWLLALVVVSVLVPALTAQWSDRQKELDLKTSLISEVTGSAAVATQDAISLVSDEAKSLPSPGSVPSPAKNAAWRTQYRNILRDWRIAAYKLESELHAYFPDTTFPDTTSEGSARVHERCLKKTAASPDRCLLNEAVAAYRETLEDYVHLSLDECDTNRGRDSATESLRGYLEEEKLEEEKQGHQQQVKKWQKFIRFINNPSATESGTESGRGSGPECWRKSDGFRQAYQAFGGLILDERNKLVDAIIDSNAAGYNVGFRDLLHQVVPVY